MEQASFSLCVIGIGSIGQQALLHGLDAGFSTFTIVDGDTVEQRNIGRQPMCTTADIGRPKVSVALEHMNSTGRPLRIKAVPAFLDLANARDLIGGHDLVLDCTDDLHARYLVDRTCEALQVPLIGGAVHRDQGQVVLLHSPSTDGTRGPSLRAFFPGRANAAQDACDMMDVPPELPARIAQRMIERALAFARGEHTGGGLLEVLENDSTEVRSYTLAGISSR